jgi:hypothetical protein
MKTKKLILFGDSAFAEIAYEYFTFDSEYEVVAFTVSKEYLSKEKLNQPYLNRMNYINRQAYILLDSHMLYHLHNRYLSIH